MPAAYLWGYILAASRPPRYRECLRPAADSCVWIVFDGYNPLIS
jgi:hypothetical protein